MYQCDHKMKNKKYYTVGRVPKPNRKIEEIRDQIYTTNTKIQDHSISSLGTDISIKSGGATLVLCAQIIDHFIEKRWYDKGQYICSVVTFRSLS